MLVQNAITSIIDDNDDDGEDDDDNDNNDDYQFLIKNKNKKNKSVYKLSHLTGQICSKWLFMPLFLTVL